MMSAMGGSNQQLEEGLEQFFSDASGDYADIGTLHNLQMYPVIEMDISDLTLKSEPGADPWLSAGHLLVSMRFWDVFFSRRRIISMEASGVEIVPGYLGGGGLLLREAGLRRDATGEKAFFEAHGEYAFLPLHLVVPVKSVSGENSGPLFVLQNIYDIDASLGAAGFSGRYVPAILTGEGSELQDIRLTLKGDQIAEGKLGMRRSKENPSIYGGLVSGSSQIKFVFYPDAESGEIRKGTISFPVFAVDDFREGGKAKKLVELLTCFAARTGTGDLLGPGAGIEVTIDHENANMNEFLLSVLKTPDEKHCKELLELHE